MSLGIIHFYDYAMYNETRISCLIYCINKYFWGNERRVEPRTGASQKTRAKPKWRSNFKVQHLPQPRFRGYTRPPENACTARYKQIRCTVK